MELSTSEPFMAGWLISSFLVIILKTLFWQIFDICGCSNCAWSNSFTQSEENGRDWGYQWYTLQLKWQLGSNFQNIKWWRSFPQTSWPKWTPKYSQPSLDVDLKELKALWRRRLLQSQSWWPSCLQELWIQGICIILRFMLSTKSHNVNTIILSPFLYNNTMYTMAGLVTTASALHFMVGRQNLFFLQFNSLVDSCCLSHV